MKAVVIPPDVIVGDGTPGPRVFLGVGAGGESAGPGDIAMAGLVRLGLWAPKAEGVVAEAADVRFFGVERGVVESASLLE